MSRARLRWSSEALTAGARGALGTALFHCRDAGQHRQQRRCHCWTALPASASQRTGNLCRSSHSWGQKRESPQERRASPNCTFTNLPVRARGAPEASKRRTVSSKSLLKFRSHQEDHCRQASSWAGPLTEAKHHFPVQARTVIQEGQRPNEELRWPQKLSTVSQCLARNEVIQTNRPQAMWASFLKCQLSFWKIINFTFFKKKKALK